MKIFITLIYSFLFVGVVAAQSERSLIRDGNRLYRENKFADAEVSYRKALEENKETKEGIFNLGDALYKQGRYGEAAEEYRNAATKYDDVTMKAKALHNLGNALLKGQKLPESIAAYKEALKLNPKDVDTKYNLEYAKALLKQQDQQQKKQNKDQKKNDQQKQGQQKQDQSKQDQQKGQQQNEQQRQSQQKKQQISKEDAERILEALRNEEKDVQKKLHKRVPARVRVEKDW